MKLQDYAQYYIGCRCFNTWFQEEHKEYNKGWVLSGYAQLYANGGKPFLLESENEVTWTDSIKLILRKVDSMDDLEIKQFINWGRLNELYVHVSYERVEHAIVLNYSIPTDNGEYPQSVIIRPEIEVRSDQFHHLISHGFDVFGLIDAGLAIDSKTLK